MVLAFALIKDDPTHNYAIVGTDVIHVIKFFLLQASGHHPTRKCRTSVIPNQDRRLAFVPQYCMNLRVKYRLDMYTAGHVCCCLSPVLPCACTHTHTNTNTHTHKEIWVTDIHPTYLAHDCVEGWAVVVSVWG